jgi:hypothetical protein
VSSRGDGAMGPVHRRRRSRQARRPAPCLMTSSVVML